MQIFDRIASELAYLKGSLRILSRISPIAKNPTYTICDLMQETAAKFGDRVALISDRETLTFRQYNARANQYARWARAQGIGKGDVVALLMLQPAGLSLRLAGRGACRRRDGPDQHEPHRPGAGAFHRHREREGRHRGRRPAAAPIEAAAPFIPNPGELWVHSDGPEGSRNVGDALANYSDADLATDERTPLTIEDRCVFIYTSGTTGLPKAANINHYRIMAMAKGFSALMDTQPDDRMYDCLPMYHSNGGVPRHAAASLVQGGSVVIRERFSAREFWTDIVRHGCTLFFYIGELCRYLVNAPPGQNDRRHKHPPRLRQRPAARHLERFRQPLRHREHQGVLRGHRGQHRPVQPGQPRPEPVGRIPKWAERRFVVKVVRFDIETRGAGPRPRRLLHPLRAGRGGRGHRPDPQRSRQARQPLRGLCRQGRDRAQDPARRLREGRCLVPLRRPA